MGVMIREWPVNVSGLTLVQEIGRVQKPVCTCDCRDALRSEQFEIPRKNVT